MNGSRTNHSQTLSTAPVFTLGSALRWLGHDCPDRSCTQPIDALPASIWFLWDGHPFPAYPLRAVVVVDLTETEEPHARLHRLIDEVDRCTRAETLLVRHGHSGDNGHDLIALQMNQTPVVRFPSDGRGHNIGGFEIAARDPGVVSYREGPQHVSQDRTQRQLRRLRVVH